MALPFQQLLSASLQMLSGLPKNKTDSSETVVLGIWKNFDSTVITRTPFKIFPFMYSFYAMYQ